MAADIKNYDYTTGGDSEICQIEPIAKGGYGEVHKVKPLLFRIRCLLLCRCGRTRQRESVTCVILAD